MKKLSLFILSAAVVLTYLSCVKSTPASSVPPCTNKPVTADSATLISFAGDTIPLTHDTTGLYYHIIDSGNSTHPGSYSYLRVTYVAKLMNQHDFRFSRQFKSGGCTIIQSDTRMADRFA